MTTSDRSFEELSIRVGHKWNTRTSFVVVVVLTLCLASSRQASAQLSGATGSTSASAITTVAPTINQDQSATVPVSETLDSPCTGEPVAITGKRHMTVQTQSSTSGNT